MTNTNATPEPGTVFSSIGFDTRLLQQRLLMAAAAVTFVLITLVMPFPVYGRLWGELFNLAHAPVFCLLTICGAAFFDPTSVGLGARFAVLLPMTLLRVALLAMFIAAVGVGGEILQSFSYRSPSLSDIRANCMGIAAACCWIASSRFRPGSRWPLRTIAPGILIGVSILPALEAAECIQQRQQFPLLASFERPRELGNWRPRDSEISLSTNWSTDGKSCLQIDYLPGQYPTAIMIWPINDWSAYPDGTLQFDLHNPSSEDIDLFFKVQDRSHIEHGWAHDDRFERAIHVAAGAELSVEIPMQELRLTPSTRQMEMDRIELIEFFCIDRRTPATLHVDNIRLTP